MAVAPPGSGFGATTLEPALKLAIPPATPAGPYNGSLTVTAIAGSA
jgi:hypothetical protein